VQRPDVDPDRIALTGWSLGGYLALRAATGEHRLAACIADPALFAVDDGMVSRLEGAGVPAAALASYPDLSAEAIAAMEVRMTSNRLQRWAINRGFMVHGVDSFADYVHGQARERIGVPNLHLHDLRHTGNALAAQSGVSRRDLMTRMDTTPPPLS